MTARKVKITLSRLKAKHAISHHPLTLADFDHICEAEGVSVFLAHLKTGGFIFRKDNQTVIALDSKLQPEKLLHVAYHELAHYLMHKPDTAETMFKGEGKSPKETEADLFADLATR